MEDTVIDFRKERQNKAKSDALTNCRFLYTGRSKPMTESLMCFGWECPDTWNEILRDLSYQLEELNIRYYPKYKTRIEAVQVKEKFGTLRFYYDLHVDPPSFAQCWSNMADRMSRFLDCGNRFKYKTVEDSPRHVSHEVKEISKERYDKAEKGKYKCVNVDYQVEGLRYFEVVHHDMYAITHQVPTKHRLRYKFMLLMRRLAVRLDVRHSWKQSPEQKIIVNIMGAEADRLISSAETKTEHVCSACGVEIGYDTRHPACETTGWISYLCRRCAAEHTGNYVMNGKLYNGDKEVQKDKPAEEQKNPEPLKTPVPAIDTYGDDDSWLC